MNDIKVELDEADREIECKGGRHPELRLRNPHSGEHEYITSRQRLGPDPKHGEPLARREDCRHS
ncbi:MAG: hypothetical protein JO212_03985 [Acetobacteraceae bacterium]|nr:hypothetical protein [Acetobacteraceae bacterium]